MPSSGLLGHLHSLDIICTITPTHANTHNFKSKINLQKYVTQGLCAQASVCIAHMCACMCVCVHVCTHMWLPM